MWKSKLMLPALCIVVLVPKHALAVMTQLSSTSQIVGPTILYSTPGAIGPQTSPFGVDVFATNSFATTIGISSLFGGNADAPISRPSALELGSTPGPATYFHFAPTPGYSLHAIGLSATGVFDSQSTTFRVLAIDANSNQLQYDVTMTPTGPGFDGLNGGAVFLGVSSTVPLVAFRVGQLDDGWGILDNLRLDVSPIPEPSTLVLALAAAGILATAGARGRRRSTTHTSPAAAAPLRLRS